MANKNFQINLAFTADTSRAKAQLMELQKSLNTIISSPVKSDMTDIMKRDLEEASYAAAELSVHLKNATNQKTGSLDFTKLNQSIKQSGNSLVDYAKKLQAAGTDGQKAFLDLAEAVSMAEVPIRRSSELMAKFWENLKKTAGWQISSNILHGLESSINSAYGYAQDLNESLNNIRIVTGQNIDQMAEFAAQANKAAKALSTTTTNYTNASLIYYQQGLSDQEVLERTNVTVKMANVARASAEDVSDQMTAVWNNFYDGSKSLEYYADVMTALGAATASSTEEISAGLNKFAAVAETVGLSYEYAASALATVTSTTRQSADVVGTAFKTLFARIQDLKLGETLDDGTTLGTYSESLAKVGIDIKDVNKEIKDMDTILEEMADKWKTLDKDAQIALAQNVAGVRQYTQLIALMDNWDFFQENLSTSLSSSGTLNEQAEIYAESWEAAQDRVTAALENIYSKIIDDEAFIDILNGVENIVTGVDHLIDGIGGLNGVLATLGTLFTKIFSKQLSQSLTNIAYNMQMMTEAGRKKIQNEKVNFLDDAMKLISGEVTDKEENNNRNTTIKNQMELQTLMIENADKMSEAEKEINQILLDRIKIQNDQLISAGQAYDQAKEQEMFMSMKNRAKIDKKDLNVYDEIKQNYRKSVIIETQLDDYSYFREKDGAKNRSKILDITKDSNNEKIQEYIKSLTDANFTGEELQKTITEIQRINNEILTSAEEDFQILGLSAKNIEEEKEALAELTRQEAENKREKEQYGKTVESVKKKIEESKGAQKSWADTFVAVSNSVMGVVSAFQMLGGLYDIITNPDLSTWEKFTKILTTVGMLIPVITITWDSFSKTLNLNTTGKILNVVATEAQAEAENDAAEAKKNHTKETKKQTKEDLINSATKVGR